MSMLCPDILTATFFFILCLEVKRSLKSLCSNILLTNLHAPSTLLRAEFRCICAVHFLLNNKQNTHTHTHNKNDSGEKTAVKKAESLRMCVPVLHFTVIMSTDVVNLNY